MKTGKLSRLSMVAWVGIATVACLMLPSPSQALNFTLNTEFSGSGDTATGYPVVTLTGTGTVNLTIQSNFTPGSGEFIRGIYLNLDPTFNATNLSFSYVSGDVATVNLGTDAFQAGGDGKYDILLSYANAPPSARFQGTESSVYTITCALCGAGFSESSFNFLSASAGGHGPFLAVARLQGLGTDNEGSGWFTTGNGNGRLSEPSPLILIGTMLILFSLLSRRLQPKKV